MERKVMQRILGKILFLMNGAMVGIILGLLFENCEMEKKIVEAGNVTNVMDTFEEEEKICYLTFDDGPSHNTEKILDLLKEYKAKATFFVIGNSLGPENKAVIERIVEEGHCIGLHANNHSYEKFYKDEESWLEDYELLDHRLQSEYGIKASLFRFPGGSACKYMKGNVKEHIAVMHAKGMICFDWIVSGEDSLGNPTPNSIYQKVLKQALKYHTPVVLLHDSTIADATVVALEDILKEMSSQGYRFETLEKRKEYIFRSSRE